MQNFGLLRKPPFLGGNFVCPRSNFFPRVGPLWTTNYFGGSRKVTLLFQVLATTILHNQTFYDSPGIAIISIFQCFRVVAAILNAKGVLVLWHISYTLGITIASEFLWRARWRSSPTRRWTHPMWSSLMICACSQTTEVEENNQKDNCQNAVGFGKAKMIFRSSIHGFHNGSPFFLCLRGLQVWYLRQPGQSSWGCSHLCARGRVKRKMTKMKRRTTVTLFAKFTLFYMEEI